MKLPYLLFAILLAMCTVIAATFILGETPVVEVVSPETGEVSQVPRGHGFAHPELANMQVGGDGALRHEQILWFGWAFGILQVAFFVALIAYGGSKQGKLGPLKAPILIAGILYAVTFTAIVYTYQGYMLEDDHTMFLSLPVPTAWMIYGLWIVPMLFVLLYMLTFDSWTFRDEDMKRFEELVAQKRTGSGDQA
ncbi:MAG: hypothetical protein HKN47_19670 [Pirellulaceae bacterium]|nr:hypothetical protein [Pirellulaceae bacterium]